MERHVHHFPIGHLIGDRIPEEIAEDLAVSTRTVQRWIEHGVNWEQADIFAANVLGSHPISVFGPDWLDAAADANRRHDDNQPALSDIFDAV